MENSRTSIFKYIIKYGFIFGISSILFSLCIYFSGNYTIKNLFHASSFMLINISCIVISLSVFKKKNHNSLTIRESLIVDVGLTVFGGLIAILWKQLFIHILDPSILDKIYDKNFEITTRNSTELAQKDIDRNKYLTKKYTSPLEQIIIALIENLLLGFLLSFIMANY